ncbi:pro-adrenomedullin-like [Paralichthys olivaceus]|uniref:pro-adrenomedullin-like n=1 Tax=Paralichthys olivaceus TaxID=8255 RepID=UPI00097DD316|nr:PREDICTED: ADM-like [Paralichthys olivaceus]
MRLALHTIICCCVFTTVLPLVKDATEELNSSLKKRFKVWLQSHAKRDLGSSLVTANEQISDVHVGPQQGENAKTASTQLSFGLNGRSRRSTSSKQSSCLLVTCVYHDLFHRLHKIKNSQRDTNAPENKIGAKGYGRRRRRSLLYVTQPALHVGRLATEAGQQVCRYNSVCTVA